MGKQNFSEIYKEAAEDAGGRPSIKISSVCDNFNPRANYAGLIIYRTYGQHQWRQRPWQGVAGGSRGRAFYVLIKCTDSWPPNTNALRAAGEGRAHDYLYRQYFQMDFRSRQTCCGGFAVRRGHTVYSSVYLNMQGGSVKGLRWQSDGSKHLSKHEQALVDRAVALWSSRGPGAVVQVPDGLHAILTGFTMDELALSMRKMILDECSVM